MEHARQPHPDSLAIVIASDDNFVPHLAALLLSILDSAGEACGVDIIVLDGGISEYNRHLLSRMFSSRARPSDRLSHVRCERFDAVAMPVHMNVTTPALYRLSLCSLLPGYERVIYLDCDTIVLEDLSGLWGVDLGGAAIGAAPDLLMRVSVARGDLSLGQLGGIPARKYFEELILSGGHIDDYFQSGVLLVDLKRCREMNVEAGMVEDIARTEYWYIDQDVLNKHLHDHVKHLDTAWNCLSGLEKALPWFTHTVWEPKIKQDVARPRIIHYAGVEEKPWNDPLAAMSEPYWYYARQTYWYEETLRKSNLRRQFRDRRLHGWLQGLWRLCPVFLKRLLAPLKYKYLSVTHMGRGPDRHAPGC